MKLSHAFALMIAVFSTSALSQSMAVSPQISVSGTAEIKVVPDEIYLRVGVESRDANLEAAKRVNDEKIAKAIAFLKSSGIAAKDIQTDFVSVEPNYDSRVSRTEAQVYEVRKSIEVKLTKIDSFEEVLTGLLKNGVNYVHGVEFRTSQLRKHRDAARLSAIRAATEKADALAAALGVKRGKVSSVNANDWGGFSTGSYWGGRYANQMSQNVAQVAGGASETAETMSLGQISISASVSVSFLIE